MSYVWACRGAGFPGCCQRFSTDMPAGVHRTDEQLEAVIERHELQHRIGPLIIKHEDGTIVNYTEPIAPRLWEGDLHRG